VTDEHPLLQPGDVVAGKYQIERLLGAGGMGQVFEATHRVTGKGFAVKWMLPELSKSKDSVWRFIREAQVAGRFEHPNVVEVYDVGEERGSFYMVMELLRGQSLKDWIDRGGRPSASEICEILIPCMRGVARAHAAGIVHRDLKPDNIFLCEATDETPARPKVLDFGISKMEQLEGELARITQTGAVMGTPHYMSPEQVRGKEVDQRSDIYAFGVVLYEMFAGRPPFDAETFSELVLQIATETPPSLRTLAPDVPDGLVRVVERAMARDADARYASLDEMIAEMLPFAPGAMTTGSRRLASSQATSAASPPQPFAATQRLETPLSTESVPDAAVFKAGSRPRGLILGVGLAALAVVAMGVFAVKLLGSSAPDTLANDRAGEGSVEAPARAAASAGARPVERAPDPAAANVAADTSARVPVDTSTEGPPRPTTVRIDGAEPVPREKSAEQEHQLEPAKAAEPGPQRAERGATLASSGQAAALRQAQREREAAELQRKRREARLLKARARKARSGGKTVGTDAVEREAAPAEKATAANKAPSTGTEAAASESRPAATPTSGRLGIRMDRDDF
jgi:serine/threonine-protein kinase